MNKFFKLALLFSIVLTISNNLMSQNNRDLFFVFLNSNPDKEKISESKVEELQAAHLKNIDNLAKEGKLVAAGPFDGGGGMFILRAEDYNQAKQYLETDPAIAADRYIIEVHPFSIYNGDLCGAKEPHEMVTYQIVRISMNEDNEEALAKANYDTRLFMSNIHNGSKELVAHGRFENQRDGVLILNVPNVETADALMKTNPAVTSGVLTYDIKTLWIAKGTFCE